MQILNLKKEERLSLSDLEQFEANQKDVSQFGGINEPSVEKWFELGQRVKDWLIGDDNDCH